MKTNNIFKQLIVAVAMAALTAAACLGLSACDEGVAAESITLSKTEVVLESKATQELTYTVQPEDATVKVEVSDKTVVKYENNTLTALTAGTATVKVYSTVDNSVYAECAVTVNLPDGYTQYTGADCKFAYPSTWSKTTQAGTVVAFQTASGSASVNLVSEKKNNAYFRASADTFKTAILNAYKSTGYSVNFTSCTAEKTTYAGYERVRIVYDYTLSLGSISRTLHQEQMILHSGDKTFTLTVTYGADNVNTDQIQTILSEFAGLK